MIRKNICAQCGKEYERDSRNLHKDNKFCSPKCYHASRVGVPLIARRRRHIKICPVCGKEFETGGRAGLRGQTRCSMECQKASRYRSGAKSNTLALNDATYMAGFLDGEGSIILISRRGKAGLRLIVVNTNKDVIDWFGEVTGVGNVYQRRRAGQYNKAIYHWFANAEAAESVIQQIQPYLKVKKAQAQLALETQERLRDPALNADRSWQEEYIIRMKRLNARANSKFYAGG